MRSPTRAYTAIIILSIIVSLGCSAGSLIVRAPQPTPTPTKTPRQTFTPTLIPTDTPSATSTPTWTPAPTNPPTPTEDPTESAKDDAAPQARVTGNTINVRQGPSTAYPRIGRVTNGHTSEVLGRNNDSSWILINHSDGQGWMSAQFAAIEGDLNRVDVIQVEPPPAPPPPPPAANNPPPPPTNTPPPPPTAAPSYPFPAAVVTHPTGGEIEFRISALVWEGSASGIGQALSGFQMEVVTPSGEVKTSEISVGPKAGASTVQGAGDNHAMNFQFKTAPYVPGVYKVTLKKDGAQMAATVDVTAQAGPPFSYAHIDFLKLQ